MFVLLALILLGLAWWGWDNGVRAAKAKRIIKDAQVMASAFEEFRKDQNRYPVTTEFEDNSVMRAYITNFPPQSFPSEACPESFDYFSANSQTYELRFCLPKAVGDYQIGWNALQP